LDFFISDDGLQYIFYEKINKSVHEYSIEIFCNISIDFTCLKSQGKCSKGLKSDIFRVYAQAGYLRILIRNSNFYLSLLYLSIASFAAPIAAIFDWSFKVRYFTFSLRPVRALFFTTF
jgi:hypothetical protein